MACPGLVREGSLVTDRCDYVVVGAGVLGLSAARALARRGLDVTVLEQAEVGHPGAGSKGSCRIFRLGYPDPAYVAAARRARVLWSELEADCGRQLLSPTPQLTFGDQLTTVHQAMLAAGAPCELLSAAQAADRFPGVAASGPALLEPQSCVTAADAALQALAAAGPQIRTGVRVAGLADDGRRVSVRTDAGTLSVRVAIVCAGPWTRGLLADVGAAVPSAPTLEQVAYLRPAGEPRPGMPIFLCHRNSQSPYGLPVPGSALYKVGIHASGPPAGPDRQDQAADTQLSQRIAQLARRFLPGHDPRPVAIERCIYDNSPDQDFVVDRVGNVVIGSGTSGHGFKFGPLFGEWLARLAAGQRDQLPDSRFALARFSSAGAGSGPQ
jgi:sarcosine oxidase